jgi:hypothetical protein
LTELARPSPPPSKQAGIDEEGFRARLEQPLVDAVTQRVLSQPPFTFVSQLATVPAGAAFRSLLLPAADAAPRRRLQAAVSAAATAAEAAAAAAAAAAASAGAGHGSVRLGRSLRQEGDASLAEGSLIPRWLQVVVVAGGTTPLQMYYAGVEKLT